MIDFNKPNTVNSIAAGGNDDPRASRRGVIKKLLWVCLGVNCVLGLLIAYMLFLHSHYFNLEQVDVTGIRRLSRAEVIEASEIDSGMSLLTADLNSIAERLRRHPWVRSASVLRRFPGQIIIEIDERIPRGILAAGKLYYVDDQGEPFTRLLPGDSIDFPLFTGIHHNEFKANLPEIRELVRSGFNLLDLIDRTESDLDGTGIAEIKLDQDEGLTVQTRSGRWIVLGKGDYEAKLMRYGRLKRILTQKGEWTNARIINLDFEDRALVRSDKTRLQG
jgi:cell division protein FtsQ